MGAEKQDGRFSCKIALRLKKVCYKVSLCENCQRQSCKTFIGLNIHAKMIGGDVPFYAKIWRILTHPPIFCLFSSERCRRHSVFELFVCGSVRDHIHGNMICHKPLVGFHEIYNCGEFVDKDELIRCWGQKVIDQGHSETTWNILRSKVHRPKSQRDHMRHFEVKRSKTKVTVRPHETFWGQKVKDQGYSETTWDILRSKGQRPRSQWDHMRHFEVKRSKTKVTARPHEAFSHLSPEWMDT